jgi:hypothetical protein
MLRMCQPDKSTESYLSDCMKIARQVFELTFSQLEIFNKYARDLLYESIDNPFNTHEHPLYFVAQYYGIPPHNTPELEIFERKFDSLNLKLWWLGEIE